MKYLLALFATLYLAAFSVYGQENVLYFEVQQARGSNTHFENGVLRETGADTAALRSFVNPDEVFFFSGISIDVERNESKAISLVMPLKTRNMVLELVEVPEYFYNYEVRTSDGKILPANREIKHYRGVVKDVENSLVAITFYKNEIMGLISTDEGNFNLVRDHKSGKHIFYNDRNLREKPNIACETVDDRSFSYDPEVLLRQRDVLSERTNAAQSRVINKEVRFYVETEYDIYQWFGNVPSVEAFMAGLFNQVAILYLNEDILTSVSCMYIWTFVDPYTAISLSSLLEQFQNIRTSIIGDLGILLTFRLLGGGMAAGTNGLCNSSTRQKLAVGGVYEFYDIVPNYSEPVGSITHEFGHLLGSRHTHDCVWNGNNTAIDSCGSVGGNCWSPGLPLNGGTIMSYCHLDSTVGINFNLGFGPQPGNVIRNSVINANCLMACNSPINFTNQTVTQGININSCGTINVQNVDVQSGERLILDGSSVNIFGNFNVQNGAELIIRANP